LEKNHTTVSKKTNPMVIRKLLQEDLVQLTGINLLKYKLYHYPEKQICIPEENRAARSYMEQHAYKEYLRAPRMVLYGEVSWKPEWIYCRATGYCG